MEGSHRRAERSRWGSCRRRSAGDVRRARDGAARDRCSPASHFIVPATCGECLGQGDGRRARQRNRGAVDWAQSRSPSRPRRFAISAVFAGLAGAIFAPLMLFVAPDSFPFSQSILFLLAVIVGGSGWVLGPRWSGAVVTVMLPELLSQPRRVSAAVCRGAAARSCSGSRPKASSARFARAFVAGSIRRGAKRGSRFRPRRVSFAPSGRDGTRWCRGIGIPFGGDQGRRRM